MEGKRKRPSITSFMSGRLEPQISRLTKSAKKEAEDWARQTKRTLVMEMIKQRKHTWISRPKRQVLFLAKSLGQLLINKLFSEK